MDRETLFLILVCVLCGCLVLLSIVVIYLCVVVRRIRRDLKDLSNGGHIHLENASNKNKGEEGRKRMSSGNMRYVVKRSPENKQHRQPSAVYSDPEETVTYLEREVRPQSSVFGNAPLETTNSTQNTPERTQATENIPLQFVNKGFSPDAGSDPTRESFSEAGDSQSIHSNEEESPEQPIYENNNELEDGEPVYQNTGELAAINNPEWKRCNTMDISEIA